MTSQTELLRRIHVQRRHLTDEGPDGEQHPVHELELLHRHTQFECGAPLCWLLFPVSVPYLLLGDPRLLLAIPFVIIQAAAVSVKYVQVVDSHLKHV